MVTSPFGLRRTEPLQPFRPQRQERRQVRKHASRDGFHVLDGIGERADPVYLPDRTQDRVGALRERRRGVHANRVLGHARLRVDAQDIRNTFFLTEIDFDIGDREKNRLENGPGGGVVSRVKGLRDTSEVFGDVVRVRVAELARRIGERPRLARRCAVTETSASIRPCPWWRGPEAFRRPSSSRLRGARAARLAWRPAAPAASSHPARGRSPTLESPAWLSLAGHRGPS